MLQAVARVSVTAVQPDAMGASGSCPADFLGGTILKFTPSRALWQNVVLVVSLAALAGSFVGFADDDGHFQAGNLMVSRSVYHNDPDTITVGMSLPPACVSPNCVSAKYDGTYPTVWNNAPIDSSFGITSKIFLDQLTPSGWFINTLEVPNSSDPASRKNQMVTSFSSKSELALNLSTDRRRVTFMGYLAPIDAIDVSNSNTPGAFDPTNPVAESVLRLVAEVDRHGHFQFTETNAYSGNNGRAAILNNKQGEGVFYLAGNAGNGSNPQPTGIILGAGAQILTPEDKPEDLQSPGIPTPVASFNITQLLVDPTMPAKGFNKADKVGKDDNFRGLTVFDDVIYYTKGSGGNGVNTVYFVDTTGLACPMTSSTPGVGLPLSSASLPLSPIVVPSPVPPTGLPSNMCVLAGFPTLLAKSSTGVTNPFGLWFANDHTVYVTDEGDGSAGSTAATFYAPAAAQAAAGLQKWVLDDSSKTWQHVYTLQAGLGLGVPYTVAGYPTGPNLGNKSLPWSPAADGLRNLTGRVNGDGSVTVWAITSTVSGNGDQGADPNKLVAITDRLSASTLPVSESFKTIRTARYGEVLRGVSFTPGTGIGRCDGDGDATRIGTEIKATTAGDHLRQYNLPMEGPV
jgi:hypothetical protein